MKSVPKYEMHSSNMKFCICQLDIVGEGCAAPGAVRAGRLMGCHSGPGPDEVETLARHSEDTLHWACGDMRTLRGG